MKRRRFLKGVGLGIGGASVPLWFSSAFGLDDRGEELCDEILVTPPEVTPPEVTPPEVTPRPGALRPDPADPVVGGAPIQRPRLYLVIPSDLTRRRERGRVFGEFFNHGDELGLAQLAVFDIVCATTAEISASTGAAIIGEPWLVVVDMTRTDARPASLDDPELSRLATSKGEERDEVIDARIGRLSDLVKVALEPAMLERMRVAEAQGLSDPLREELSIVLEQQVTPRLAVVAAAPATLLGRLRVVEEGKGDWMAAELNGILTPRLAELTRERFVRSKPPQGARWGWSGGCGSRIEGSRTNVAIGCGMGHVPERSRRFLSFLVEDESP